MVKLSMSGYWTHPGLGVSLVWLVPSLRGHWHKAFLPACLLCSNPRLLHLAAAPSSPVTGWELKGEGGQNLCMEEKPV